MTEIIVLTANQDFFCAPGSATNNPDGSFRDPRNSNTPWPDPASIVGHLQQNFDLNFHQARIMASAGVFQSGVTVSGLLRGQKTPNDFVIEGAGHFLTSLQPIGAASPSGPQPSPAEINWDAKVTFRNINLDTSHTKQDNLMVGEAARVVLDGNVLFTKQTNQSGENCMSVGGFSGVNVNAHLWIDGDMQDFLQIDQYGKVYFNTNGQPNMLAMYFLYRPSSLRQPIFYSAFLDVQSGNANVQAIDYHGYNRDTGIVPLAVTGARIRSRSKDSVINIAAPVGTLPGNSDYYNEGPPNYSTPQGTVK